MSTGIQRREGDEAAAVLVVAQPSGSSKPEGDRGRVLEGGTLIPLGTAFAIVAATVAVPATFFATRYSLEGRIASIEAQLETRLAFRDELDRATFTSQRNLLHVLAQEIQRLRGVIGDGQAIVAVYEPLPGWKQPPPPAPAMAHPEMLKSLSSPARTMDLRALNAIAYDVRFLAVPDPSLIVATGKLLRVMQEYNTAIGRASPQGLMPSPSEMFQPEVRLGAPRVAVEPVLASANVARADAAKVLSEFNFDAAVSTQLSRLMRR